MRYMLDTNILIYLIKNKPASIAERINQLPPEDDLCMSFVTYAELLRGAERSTEKTRNLQRLAELTRVVPVEYRVDKSLCEHYAVQFERLKVAGTPIGGNDLWIACHALALKCVLVTNNVREFERIQQLKIENWLQ
jgi:tRNA(fMet)-specific endonuclease VapC